MFWCRKYFADAKSHFPVESSIGLPQNDYEMGSSIRQEIKKKRLKKD
jgi:hypothetical protein